MLNRIFKTLGLRGTTRPEAVYSRPLCLGRDRLCEDVLRSVSSHGCVLLFGGRQAGKTSFLHHIVDQLDTVVESSSATQVQIPVFVDLMRLPYDATPCDFFAMLALLSIQACRSHFPRLVREKELKRKINGLESFEREVMRLRSASSCDLRFVYLLDESKRVIGPRFPRGFHDNLFHLLFGDSEIQGVCSVVFAGAQELYILCEDDTSPIGSRAAKHCLTNLAPEAIDLMVQAIAGHLESHQAKLITEEVYRWTGGHAGLSYGLLRALLSHESLDLDTVKHEVDRFRTERSELFQLWVSGLTDEGRVVHDVVIDRGRISVDQIAEHLRRKGLGAYRSDRAADELQYVGIARREGDVLVASNSLYSSVARLYVAPAATTELERRVWPLVEQTELGLRQLVRAGFNAKWGAHADEHIRSGLGDDSWFKILENREKYLKSYPRSQSAIDSGEVLHFTYLGQLVQLIMWKKSWDQFKHLFRDSRELEDMIRDILPVRNDGAHFRSVPNHELDRCRVRCIDLLTILEKELQRTTKSV